MRGVKKCLNLRPSKERRVIVALLASGIPACMLPPENPTSAVVEEGEGKDSDAAAWLKPVEAILEEPWVSDNDFQCIPTWEQILPLNELDSVAMELAEECIDELDLVAMEPAEECIDESDLVAMEPAEKSNEVEVVEMSMNSDETGKESVEAEGNGTKDVCGETSGGMSTVTCVEYDDPQDYWTITPLAFPQFEYLRLLMNFLKIGENDIAGFNAWIKNLRRIEFGAAWGGIGKVLENLAKGNLANDPGMAFEASYLLNITEASPTAEMFRVYVGIPQMPFYHTREQELRRAYRLGVDELRSIIFEIANVAEIPHTACFEILKYKSMRQMTTLNQVALVEIMKQIIRDNSREQAWNLLAASSERSRVDQMRDLEYYLRKNYLSVRMCNALFRKIKRNAVPRSVLLHWTKDAPLIPMAEIVKGGQNRHGIFYHICAYFQGLPRNESTYESFLNIVQVNKDPTDPLLSLIIGKMKAANKQLVPFFAGLIEYMQERYAPVTDCNSVANAEVDVDDDDDNNWSMRRLFAILGANQIPPISVEDIASIMRELSRRRGKSWARYLRACKAIIYVLRNDPHRLRRFWIYLNDQDNPVQQEILENEINSRGLPVQLKSLQLLHPSSTEAGKNCIPESLKLETDLALLDEFASLTQAVTAAKVPRTKSIPRQQNPQMNGAVGDAGHNNARQSSVKEGDASQLQAFSGSDLDLESIRNLLGPKVIARAWVPLPTCAYFSRSEHADLVAHYRLMTRANYAIEFPKFVRRVKESKIRHRLGRFEAVLLAFVSGELRGDSSLAFVASEALQMTDKAPELAALFREQVGLPNVPFYHDVEAKHHMSTIKEKECYEVFEAYARLVNQDLDTLRARFDTKYGSSSHLSVLTAVMKRILLDQSTEHAKALWNAPGFTLIGDQSDEFMALEKYLMSHGLSIRMSHICAMRLTAINPTSAYSLYPVRVMSLLHSLLFPLGFIPENAKPVRQIHQLAKLLPLSPAGIATFLSATGLRLCPSPNLIRPHFGKYAIDERVMSRTDLQQFLGAVVSELKKLDKSAS